MYTFEEKTVAATRPRTQLKRDQLLSKVSVAREQPAGEASAPPMQSSATALPARVREHTEALSGYDMGDVQVHYNSAEPAGMGAHAFARGTDIHIGPGAERHLPHEAWHVVQQKQGRVAPGAAQAQGAPVNEEPALESEADRMGSKIAAWNAPGREPARSAAPGRKVTQFQKKKPGILLPAATEKEQTVAPTAEAKQAGERAYKRPKPITPGNIKYYEDRAIDYHARTNQNPPDYYMGYGNVYAHKFMEETKPQLSGQGQKWVDKAFYNLQKAIEDKLQSAKPADYMIETDSGKFKDFAFQTHVAAYENAGVLSLPVMDKLKIVLTPKAQDLLSDRGISQASAIAADQLAFYAVHPLFFAQQMYEAYENKQAIVAAIAAYYRANKKFFDELAQKDPQKWSKDPEHTFVRMIVDMICPTFRF
jgi:hypothetical protein